MCWHFCYCLFLFFTISELIKRHRYQNTCHLTIFALFSFTLVFIFCGRLFLNHMFLCAFQYKVSRYVYLFQGFNKCFVSKGLRVSNTNTCMWQIQYIQPFVDDMVTYQNLPKFVKRNNMRTEVYDEKKQPCHFAFQWF